LLDRGIEGVEVGVEDGGCRFHPIGPAKKFLKGSAMAATWAIAQQLEHKENKSRRLSS
jgi:hypothetical protein